MIDWQLIRVLDSDANVWDRYWDPTNGAAMIYRNGRELRGYANGVAFGPVALPDGTAAVGNRTNTQGVRIRPEAGEWWAYAWCDGPDGTRSEWKVPLLPL